jgi:large subunit ribosomal protein L25
MSHTLQLTNRTGALKKMRAAGHIPAVVYSSRMDNEHVAVGEKEIRAILKRNPHAIFEVELPSKTKQPVMIHHIQKDTLTGQLLHVDFLQINMKEKIEAVVTVHFTGEPQGTKEGGILQVETHEVLVRCMPDKLPESLNIDISKLTIGEHVSVSDLEIPSDVELLTDPEIILVTILGVQKMDVALEPVSEEAEETADTDKAHSKEKVH